MLESQIMILIKLNVDWVSKNMTNYYNKLREEKKSTYSQYLHSNITLIYNSF